LNKTIRFASAEAVGASLLLVYLVFLIHYTSLADWSQLSTLEVGILVTQIARIVLVVALNKTLRTQPLFAVILLSLEVFSIPILAILGLLTSNPIYTTWVAAILTTWIGVSAIILSPFAIYEFVKSMIRGPSLSVVIVIGTLEIGGMLFLCEALLAATGKIQGLTALGTMIIQTGKFETSSLGFGGNSSNIALAVGLVIFSVGMMAYFTLENRESGTSMRISDILLIPLAGTITTIVWVFVVVSITSNFLFVFTIPTIVGALGLWGSTIDR